MDKILILAISLIIPFIAVAIGSIFTSNSRSTWYVELTKPSFNPPSWIFGPVWALLYLMMGVSLYLVLSKEINWIAFTLFGIQLLLNILWTIIFFGLKAPFYAFLEIIFLWISILITAIYFYNIMPISAYLLIPYLLWVSFASILNYSIFRLN